MSLFVASLNSGSNGNCYYLGTPEGGVLIDAGISCRETEKRMKRLGLNIRKIRGIFITHEHTDHIFGASSLSKKFNLPVYVTEKTRVQGKINLKEGLALPFNSYEPITMGDLTVTAFPKQHDAVDPASFVVSSSSVSVGVFTDIGTNCEHVVRHFKQCHAAFLESNYDAHMLEVGPYPYPLKARIREGKGHLSNVEALKLFLEHRPPFMSHLFLSHLSQVNNSPKIVRELFEPHAGNTTIVIAPRHKETKLYHIRHLENPAHRQSQQEFTQLSLF